MICGVALVRIVYSAGHQELKKGIYRRPSLVEQTPSPSWYQRRDGEQKKY